MTARPPGIRYAEPNAEVPNDIFAVLDISSWEELMGLLVPGQWIAYICVS